jgi:putative tryptophan/tyrosine transport system substrate-binding protein
VQSLARPGGNITGISLMGAELHAKCVELFREMLPSAGRIAIVLNAEDPSSTPIQEHVERAAKSLGFEIAASPFVHGASEIEAAFGQLTRHAADAIVLQGSLARKEVAELAIKHRIPTATVPRAFAEVGGLMSYGSIGPEVFRRSGFFVARILRGDRPASIPVEQPTKFELVINAKTAKAIGLVLSPSFLARADEVIE